ncbi:hypothetical protein VitviT2T_018687 [Vitis vinifera]|uniref:non-specific serine/threonine protein kinase n=2 Tax=Vitis vinifera TaxID=29760 RepID=A0ABY9CYU1_VITVI|nr:hypothetical protein VitviT2T_018687 [Vitis vinifera]
MLTSRNISNNNISGAIAPQLGKAIRLQQLDLSTNHLSGKIRKELGTDNFSSKQCIVTGGYGTVYKAEFAQWPPLSKLFSMITLGELMSHGHGGERGSSLLHLSKRKTKSPEADVEDLFAIWDHDGELLYEHIIQGIDNFSSKQCIGTGGFGSLYKTEMPIGRVVAVKKLHSSEDGDMTDLKAFKSEIHALTHIRHRNIIKFYGFSSFVENSFLVYEFMEKGSLRNILSNDKEAEKLDWMVRLNAVKGVAKALSYMHHDCSPPIIHRDISSNNVLLDSEYEAHVSDFSTTREEHELIFFAKLAYKMKVDNKTDVHSFRVVTLEVIMGKHPEELILSLLSSASSSSSSPSTVDHCLLNDAMDQRLPPPVN